MCWHLTIAVPPQAVAELPFLLDPAGGASAEPDPEISRAVGRGDPCFAVGAACACSLYRHGASDTERIRRKAARAGWSAAKLARAIAGMDDWSGLEPAVREALASIAESWGRAALFLFWADGRGPVTVPPACTVSPAALRSADIVFEGRLLVVAD